MTLRTLAALSTALDARFDIELNTLKADDTYTSRGTADAEAAPAENQHLRPRTKRYANAQFSGAPPAPLSPLRRGHNSRTGKKPSEPPRK